MEQVLDRIIQEMDELRQTEEFLECLTVDTNVKFDDPLIVSIDEYPYIYVSPVSEDPVSETAGKAGYDIRRLSIQIGIVINVSDYFDPMNNEVPGTRQLVQAMSLIRARLRRLSKRKLDGLSGVRNVVVQATGYMPDMRNSVFVKMAVTNIIVERQYPHEE